MKRLVFLVVLGLAALLASCGQQAAPTLGDVIVITQGAPAPAPADPAVLPMSQLGLGSSAIGTVTDPLAVDGCALGEAREATIAYAITGPQGGTATFDVNTVWIFDGAAWSGSTPTTITVPPRASGSSVPATVRSVTLHLGVSATDSAGSSSFLVTPFNVHTSGTPALQTPNGSATVYVSFAECAAPPANTEPTLTLPSSVTAEATSSAGATVDYSALVSADDLEDGDLTSAVVCVPASGSLFPLGDTQVDCSVTDSGDLTTTGSFTVTVQDTTPPAFSGVPTELVTLVADTIAGTTLDIAGLGIGAADVGDVSPPVSIACTPIDGSTLAIGSLTTVSCTATDSSAYPSPNTSAPVTFDVTVGFAGPAGGLLPPVKADGSSNFKAGSVVPVKFLPPSYSGGPATDLASGLRFLLVKTGEPLATATDLTDSVAGSTAWRYDATADQYVFNLSTKGIPAASYDARVEFQGVLVAEGQFSLRK